MSGPAGEGATARASSGRTVRKVLTRNAGLLLLIAVLLAVAFLYLGMPPDGRDAIKEALKGWKGETAGALYLAYAGVLLLVGAQVYSIVKRSGSPGLARKVGGVPLWLNLHIVLSVIGLLFIAIHAGLPFSFNAGLGEKAYGGLLTWLLLITTASGTFGRYLYRRMPTMKRVFRHWQEVHLVITLLFFVVLVAHILGA